MFLREIMMEKHEEQKIRTFFKYFQNERISIMTFVFVLLFLLSRIMGLGQDSVRNNLPFFIIPAFPAFHFWYEHRHGVDCLVEPVPPAGFRMSALANLRDSLNRVR